MALGIRSLVVAALLGLAARALDLRSSPAEARGSLQAQEEASESGGVEAAKWMNGALYRMTQREEGLKPVGPPHDTYGGDRYLVKFPRSWVDRINKLRGAGQSRAFNFIGALRDLSAESSYPAGVRDWILPFVKENFLSGDYFQDTNPLPNATKMGAFDHSFDVRNFTKQQRLYADDQVPFDETYFRTLCSSEFTLAPAGDLPYSYRFVEAILCGSIPIVDQEKYANAEHHQYWAKVKLSKKIGWEFYTPDRVGPYNATMAARNYVKAIRYHTLMSGFNDDELCGPGDCAK